jgi:hypothetical protein
MNIHILDKNNRPTGPYSDNYVRSLLANKQILPDTLACRDGGAEWVPIVALLNIARPTTPQSAPQQPTPQPAPPPEPLPTFAQPQPQPQPPAAPPDSPTLNNAAPPAQQADIPPEENFDKPTAPTVASTPVITLAPIIAPTPTPTVTPTPLPTPTPTPTTMSIYILDKNNKSAGPYSNDYLRNSIATKQISPNTLACLVGSTEWVPIGSLLGIAYSAPPPPPPPSASADATSIATKIKNAWSAITAKIVAVNGFIKRNYLSTLDSGGFIRKPFKIIYRIFALLNFIPFLGIFGVIALLFDKKPFSVIFGAFLVWIIIAFASWVSIVFWWNRSSKIGQITAAQSEFVVTPVLSNIIQTLGEWTGSYIMFVGSLGSFFIALFIGQEIPNIAEYAGGFGFLGIIVFAIAGFLIILLTRFLAEGILAVAAIANNTALVASNIKNIPVPKTNEKEGNS